LNKVFLKAINLSQFFLATLLALQFQIRPALSATTTIDSSNNLNFTGDGSLIVDSAKTFNSITTTGAFGNINFSTTNSLTIANSIGTSVSPLNNISYNANGTLNLGGDLYLNNGVTTTNKDSGIINLTSEITPQTIESSLGTSEYMLNQLSINNASRGAIFKKDVNVTKLVNKQNGSEISGSGNLNFINADINDNLKISSSGNVNIGNVGLNLNGETVNSGTISIANTKTLIINNSSTSLTNLAIAGSGKIIINDAKTLNVLGNISGATSSINALAVTNAGDPINTAVLSLSGKITQTIQASIGDASTRITNLNVNNVISSEKPSISNGIALENDAYLNNIRFTNSANTSKISIATGKNISLSKNISETSGGKGILTGAGKLILDGDTDQTIDANLGTSSTDRLGELQIDNTSKITLNDESYITKLTSSKITSLANNSLLNISNLDVQKSLKISGSGAFEIALLNIENGKSLTFEDDKIIKITNAVTGDGAIKTSSSGTGNILFSSNSDINVATQIGESLARLNKISVGSDKAVNFNSDVFASSINFTNSAGQSKIAISPAKTLDISGDISNLSDSIITGDGTLNLSGTSKEQNIYAKIGDSANPLNTLQINNPFGAIFYQDSFVNTLTLTSGAIKIAGKTLTIDSGLDLTNQSFTSKVIDDFGKINSQNLTVADSTNISFDYSNNNANLAFTSTSSTNTATQYSIIESANAISGDIATVKVSDNSYLFDNILKINGNKIVTEIKTSDNFNRDNIGDQNYKLLEGTLSSSTNLTSKFFRISSKENLNLALTSLKPISLETFINNALSVNDITFNAISSHVKNINLDKAIDPKNKNNKIEKSKNFELWGQIFGDKSLQKSNDSKQKFTTNNYGGIIGFDHLIKGEDNDMIIGSAITINKASTTDDLKIHSNDANYYQLTLYNNNFSKNYEGFYSKNLANLSFNKYKNLRNIKIENYQQTAKSNFGGKSYSFESGLGYKAKIFDNFSITPDFAIQYFNFSQNSYTEKGLNDVILKVKSANYNELISKFGIDFAGNFSHSQVQYKPNFSISWDRKLKNNRQLMRANFVNGNQEISNDFTILQRDKLNLGLGLNVLAQENHKFNFKYNLQVANRYLSNGGLAEYSWEF
jgi:outer membrane autotransporter protein